MDGLSLASSSQTTVGLECEADTMKIIEDTLKNKLNINEIGAIEID